MQIEKLARIDLNLLVCLKVLIEELSVTRAAARLCLSQSAVSKSLAKLREQFDDPLFVRTSYGLNATPKALFLKPKLDVLVNQLELLTQPAHFSPIQRISLSDRGGRKCLSIDHALLFTDDFSPRPSSEHQHPCMD